jgi:hypothetical protein
VTAGRFEHAVQVTSAGSGLYRTVVDRGWSGPRGAQRGPAALPTLQLTVYLRNTSAQVAPPVPARFATSTVDEGHLEKRGELWSADGRLLAESTQLALLVLS